MTETLEPMADEVNQLELAQQLLAQAKEQGIELMGPNGLLGQLTKNVLETALDAEMTEHLGYEKNDPAGRGSGNSRNGTRSKTVLTEIGPVEIDVPRDTDSSFEPKIVRKRQRRLTGIDEIVLSLSAKGLTTGEISAHFQDIYGATAKEGHHLPDHRQGARGNDRMAEPAPRSGVSGGVHRRHPRQDPRRSGHQPTDLRRDRGDRQR